MSDSTRFLQRLATAAGLASIPLIGLGLSAEPVTVCEPVAEGRTECLSPEDALARFADPEDWGAEQECPVIAVTGSSPIDTTTDPATCCYDVQIDCSVDTGYRTDGCMGRPFHQDGQAIVAGIRRRTRPWAGRPPSLDGLDPDRRATLARFWTAVALAEHASVAEFHRVCLDLARHGAPDALVSRAQRAAIDEARHARRCFALASAYAGEALEPAALPLGDSVALAKDLATLAVSTWREGCLAETCSAWLYAALGDRSQDPVVRATLDMIVRDETRHAELAWATVRWALDTGGVPVRRALEAALNARAPAAVTEELLDDVVLAGHGWAPAPVQDEATGYALAHIARPLLRALLAHAAPSA